MVELMRTNPDFVEFDIERITLQKAGLIACASMKLLTERGTYSGQADERGVDQFYMYSTPDALYSVVADPIAEPGLVANTDIHGYFPNVRNFPVDGFVTVTTRHEQQYSPDPSDVTTRVICTKLIVPAAEDSEGWWLGTTATFMKNGRPDLNAELALLKDVTPAIELATNVDFASRAVNRTLGM